jgi:hypothetical protein
VLFELALFLVAIAAANSNLQTVFLWPCLGVVCGKNHTAACLPQAGIAINVYLN